jgi:hypothetical protein
MRRHMGRIKGKNCVLGRFNGTGPKKGKNHPKELERKKHLQLVTVRRGSIIGENHFFRKI